MLLLRINEWIYSSPVRALFWICSQVSHWHVLVVSVGELEEKPDSEDRNRGRRLHTLPDVITLARAEYFKLSLFLRLATLWSRKCQDVSEANTRCDLCLIHLRCFNWANLCRNSFLLSVWSLIRSPGAVERRQGRSYSLLRPPCIDFTSLFICPQWSHYYFYGCFYGSPKTADRLQWGSH